MVRAILGDRFPYYREPLSYQQPVQSAESAAATQPDTLPPTLAALPSMLTLKCAHQSKVGNYNWNR